MVKVETEAPALWRKPPETANPSTLDKRASPRLYWLAWRDKEFQGFLARGCGWWLRGVPFDGMRSESLGRCEQGVGLGPLRLGAPRAGPGGDRCLDDPN